MADWRKHTLGPLEIGNQEKGGSSDRLYCDDILGSAVLRDSGALGTEQGRCNLAYAAMSWNYFEDVIEVLRDALSMLEATEMCLKTWNGGKGSPVNVEEIMKRGKAIISAIDQES